MKLQITAYVAATKRREPLIAKHLVGHPHHLHFGSDTSVLPPDYPLPGLPPNLKRDPRKLLGHYRAWNNHRFMAQLFLSLGADLGLFFEDDAVPNRPDWVRIVNKSVYYGDLFDVFNFHGRQMLPDQWHVMTDEHNAVSNIWVKKPATKVRCYGSLAYFLNRRSARALAAKDFDGTPIDVFLPNLGTFACMVPSPFDHDRSQGSLVDHAKPH